MPAGVPLGEVIVVIDAVLLVPGGLNELRDELLGGADWEAARAGFGDSELANQ